MPPAVTITMDVEDLRPTPDLPERVVTMTHQVLDLLAAADVRASVYVVGDLAERRPGIVRRAAAEGHEIGLHSWSHVPIPTQRPAEFLAAIRRGRNLLQDLSGQEVSGYRAPMMSLVPASAWAVPLIAEAGFTYSSSAVSYTHLTLPTKRIV